MKLTLIILVLLLSACGGGGGGDEPDQTVDKPDCTKPEACK